jgi:hypothetical protein
MGCGCLVALGALISPRLGLFLVWLFTDRIPAAFDGNWLLPILGFFLLPWTTLAWAVVWSPVEGVAQFGWAFVVLGLVFDISTHLGAAQARRNES